jgi:aerobic-type carbon monoxide dehydrogenase small subunit (CoxS/CutS family)
LAPDTRTISLTVNGQPHVAEVEPRRLLAQNPDPSPAEVREAIASNLCRCTGYQFITEAVVAAAARMRSAKEVAS